MPSAPDGCPLPPLRGVALARPSPPLGFYLPGGGLLGVQVRQSRLAKIRLFGLRLRLHFIGVLTPASLTEGSHCSSGVRGRSPPFGVGASSLGPVGPGPVGPPFPRSGSCAHGSPPCWWADVVNIVLETQVSRTPPAPGSRPQPPSAVRMAIAGPMRRSSARGAVVTDARNICHI